MRRGARAPVSRRGAERPRKRTLESLAAESPETSAGVEPAGQGQTLHGSAGASGSQTPMVSEVPTLTIPIVPTPTIFTVPPAVPLAYPAPTPVELTTYPVPPPPLLTAYQAPLPPVPTTYVAPASAAVVVPPPVPPPIKPLTAPTYADPAMPPKTPASFYATAPGIPPPAYAAVPPVIPALVVPSVPAAVPTHLTDIVTTRAWIPALAESMKKLVAEDSSRMHQFIQGLDGHLQVKLADFGSPSYIETLDRALMIESAQQRAYPDKKRK
ncbi:leucine-rich repeat extensin-like protein 2 [Zingiber officinale]|uniref:leucine-rich repeat extensin-like protein 2 n=1 Tax=Zingiber officinale TaxID=94328 RepID=UPI001C4C0136|nr:leucine-rich repeat extensin-like protein 2 [Zingiber officinale]